MKQETPINKLVQNTRANDVGDFNYNINQSLWLCLEHGDILLEDLCPIGFQGGDSNGDYCINSGSSKKLAAEVEAAGLTDLLVEVHGAVAPLSSMQSYCSHGIAAGGVGATRFMNWKS